MASSSKQQFVKCVHPCPRFITGGDTHEMCVACLGVEHAQAALEGAVCVHCEKLTLRTLRSRRAFFDKHKEGAAASVPQGSGPAAAEAQRRLRSWGSQMDLAEGLETGPALSRPSPARPSVSPLAAEARAAVSSPRVETPAPALHLSSSEEMDVASVGAGEEDPPSSSPAHEELLDVVTRAVAKLKIEWPEERPEAQTKSKLDERFLPARSQPQPRGLPFFHDLHTEVSRSWHKPAQFRVYNPQTTLYSNIVGGKQHGYGAMPQVEETLASYLSPETASSLKSPTLPTRPLRTTSALVGRAYASAGQAASCLHTMAILQAYQADLLGEIDESGEATFETIQELRKATDLSLRATKETAKSIGRSMAALVATERHLWLNLSDIKERDKSVLLDAPVSPLGLFGDSVTSVVERFQEAKRQSAAFQKFLPRRSAEAAEREQPRPSTSSSTAHRAQQKQSVATRAPPQRSWGPGRGAVLPTPPSRALRGAAVPTDPLRRAGQRLIRLLPAGAPLQGVEPSAQKTPETSLERLVPLVEFLEEWKRLPNISQWVLQMIEKGYKIQFGSRPPQFNGVLPTVVGPQQSLVMEQEVMTLLQKGAIERVPPPGKQSGFYSRYFIVPKKDGGLRPILDLRMLNRSVQKLKFKMLTLRQITTQIRSEDWFVTIDLKDAYFHVSIHPSHWKFLRFAFGGEAYQYKVLPFGLSLSPRTFTKCVDAALAPLRLQGIRVLNYIDDWLILAQSEQQAVQHRDVVLSHMRRLGLRLNTKKSVLLPAQTTSYLGVVWNSTTMQAHLSPARVNSILSTVKGVKLGQSLTVKQFQKLLGLMAAASNVIPFGLLHMRPLQWWLRTRGFSPRGNPFRTIKVTRRCLRALAVWKKPWFLSQGPVLGAPCRRKMLTTDASLTGWGAIMSGRSAQGLWGDHHRSWHINQLEMMAVFRALKYFLPDLRGHHVLVRTDNMSVVSYINHQGGLRSRQLCKLSHQILLWSQGKFLSLRAAYIPGHQNVGADILSRQGPRPGEWRLHPEVVELIWKNFGRAEVDLFASKETSHCPLWYSLTHPAPLGLDAMVQTWPRLRLYAFPPIALLPGVLERVRRDGVRLILVAPFWPTRIWFTDLVSLLEGSPMEIPIRQDLLSQAGGSIVHPRPEIWKLWAWPLRGPSS
ncbi:uncharacterized protein LOC125249543 [Megalobrama amblycephala]|uniref:uncharacterized protein LOC125249543 n=1 Tax=Megalobrama amblycephala TaxID=75352 RepID=UPI002013C729|nr:uncharacterized protein LOC125249543 [Megalobrama amblycephala]